MFKSIDYNLCLCLIFVIISSVALPILILESYYIGAFFSLVILVYNIYKANIYYTKISKNVTFLFNAIENGDYSFHFDDKIGTKRERELHSVMNRIKGILANTKRKVIEQEQFFSIVVENVSTGIIIINSNDQVKTVNQAALQLLKMPILTHLNQLKAVKSTLPQLFKNIKPSQEVKQLKIESERGEIELTIRADRLKMQQEDLKIIILNNIKNELDNREVDSWIKLIRVMTHEIMNSIAPITSLTDTLLQVIKQEQSANNMLIEGLETIHFTSKELLQFVESYRKFTRIPAPQLSNFNATKLIAKAIQLSTEQEELKQIEILFTPKEEVTLTADKGHFMQIMLNLIKNAIEASGCDSIIKVEHEIENLFTIIRIKNSGSPIPPEVMSQIFVPFFSTKEQGSGVGLSVSRYMMQLHKGSITYQYQAGWNVFSLFFPKDELKDN